MGRVNRITQVAIGTWLKMKLSRAGTPPTAHAAPAPPPPDRIKIGSVQWLTDPVLDAKQWTDRIAALFQQAADAHCHLIVFPEYVSLSLLGVIMPQNSGAHTVTDSTIEGVLKATAAATSRFWLRWMTAFSRKYGIMTVAGSSLVMVQGHLYNQTVWMDAEGTLLGRQSKLHPLPEERRWGVTPGAGLAPAAGPWGLSALVCNDATYFESFRMMRKRGANIIAVPIADPESRYTEGKARRGCFSAVQDVPMVGVVSAATGRLFGMRLTGKAGIYLPAALTPDGSGVLAESPQSVGEGLVTAVVSLSQLTQYRRSHEAQFPIPPKDFMDALYHTEEDQ